jgi:DNA polymerase III subunit gamma/tau
MSNYVVSARKYRPGTFASVVGQSHVTNTLKSAILLDQLAHAFLFSGPRGVGKTTCARILAKAINCENLQEDGEPCNQCESCLSFNAGKSINIHELDAASNNSVDDIRNLTEQTRYVPPNGRKSVYIIDEVHMLSQAAFNAFLKTLEEPPAHVLFILATTEKHKILPTILSRCQKHDFRRIKVDDIAQHLEYISKEEGIEYEFAALQQIALKADGALRDALSLYDQLVSYSGSKLTFASVLENLNILDYEYYFKAVELIREQDHASLLLLLNQIVEQGFEAKDFVVGLTEHFRNLLVCQTPKTVELLETSENVKARYAEQSQALDPTFVFNAFNLTSEAEQKTRFSEHPRLQVELALVKLAHLRTAVQVVAEAANGEAVKKKALAPAETPPTNGQPQPKRPAEAQQTASANDPPPPTADTPPSVESAQEPEPPAQEPASVEAAASAPAKRRRRYAGTPALGSSLEDMKKVVEEEKAAAPEPEKVAEEPASYELNPTLSVSEPAFAKALDQYIERLQALGKLNLAAILRNGKTDLIHNRWQLTVESELFQGMVEKEQALLPFLREQLEIGELFLEIVVDESATLARDTIPYTDEQKLQAMSQKNPNLRQLQEIFGTRIIYE